MVHPSRSGALAGIAAAVLAAVVFMLMPRRPKPLPVAWAADASISHSESALTARVDPKRAAVNAAPSPASEEMVQDAGALDATASPLEIAELPLLANYWIDTSLEGHLDPSEFLDLALTLAALDVSPTALPEPHYTGATRFRILGTPEGMQAELWVRRTNNAEFDPDVLTIRIDVERGANAVAGAARGETSAQVTLWKDPAGRPSVFGILTNADVDAPRSRDLGFAVGQQVTPFGMRYTYRLGEPQSISCALHGAVGATFGELPTTVYPGAQPSLAKIESLGASLQRWATRIGLSK